jgi:hypothetical protein
MVGSDEWKFRLSEEQRAECLAALAGVERLGVELTDIGRDEFPLPSLGPALEGLVDELMDGRGFVLIQGVPVETLNERQCELLCWGLGRHIGIAIPQGADKAPLLHVRDEGVDPSHPLSRGYQHSQKLDYHTDSPDLVALLCIRPAKAGGLSSIVSSVAVHNEIVRTRPDVAEVLYEPWWHDRRRGDGPDSFFQSPIYTPSDDGRLFAYYGPDYVRSAPRGEHVPDLTGRQLEAMDVLESLNNDQRFVLNMDFRPGDVQILNNYVTMHSRTAYEDYEDQQRRRDLIRLWLIVDRDLNLPKWVEERGLMARTVAFK